MMDTARTIALAAMLPIAAYAAAPLGARTAALLADDGDDDSPFVVLDPAGGESGDVFVGDGQTLLLTNGQATAWSVTFKSLPRLIVDALPSDGKVMSLLDGETWEMPLSLNAGGVDVGGYALCSEKDGLYVLAADAFSADGRSYATIRAALSAAGDGGTVTLLRDVSLPGRVDLAADVVVDLGGWTMSSGGRWAFNVGDCGLVVSNGCLAASDCGFYVNDGSLLLAKCEAVAARRVVQIRGAGRVHVAPDARLETTGEDPVIFAVGGISGKATVESRGTLVQSFAAGEATTAYDIAGNPNDTFGADFELAGRSGVYFAAASDACVHHPEGQGGDVGISGGWFSIRPPDEWLAPGFASRPQRFDGWDGWRVFLKTFSVRLR